MAIILKKDEEAAYRERLFIASANSVPFVMDTFIEKAVSPPDTSLICTVSFGSNLISKGDLHD